MSFYYASKKREFDKEWEKLNREYHAAGMSDTDIQEMRNFDWDNFKRERSFQTHNQSLNSIAFSNNTTATEDNSPLYKKHLNSLSCRQPEISSWGRYDWIEDIDTPELVRRLKLLSEEDIEFLSRMVVDGMSMADIARDIGVSRAAITKRVKRIRKALNQ